MTPIQLMSYVRFEANVSNTAPFDDTTLLPIFNAAKDEISLAIIRQNPDYFGEVSTTATVNAQQEYTKPDGLLLMKRIDVAYSDPTVVGAYRPATFKTLDQLKPYGEDYYAANQSTSDPVVRFDDTGFFIYPKPGVGNAINYGAAYLRLWWVQKRADVSSLSDAISDVETTTGIGSVFHTLIGDILINWIHRKQTVLSPEEASANNQRILTELVPAAFRIPSAQRAQLPDDYQYQL